MLSSALFTADVRIHIDENHGSGAGPKSTDPAPTAVDTTPSAPSIDAHAFEVGSVVIGIVKPSVILIEQSLGRRDANPRKHAKTWNWQRILIGVWARRDPSNGT